MGTFFSRKSLSRRGSSPGSVQSSKTEWIPGSLSSTTSMATNTWIQSFGEAGQRPKEIFEEGARREPEMDHFSWIGWHEVLISSRRRQKSLSSLKYRLIISLRKAWRGL